MQTKQIINKNEPQAPPQLTCQYVFTPRFLCFQGHLVKPQMAYIRFRDGTPKDQKTSNYWILAGSSDSNQPRESTRSDISGL